MIINSYKAGARFSSESAAPTLGDRIHTLIMTQEIAEFLQKEGNSLSKEDLVLVLEQLAGSSDKNKSTEKVSLLRDRCLKAIFSYRLTEFSPVYVASIMDSLAKLSENSDMTSMEIKIYWRQIEKLLSRNEFFAKIDELGLISLLLSKYSGMPHKLRDLELEEAFEKAETKALSIFNQMLAQKKLAEDVGFNPEDLSLLLESFSQSFFGSETFYETAQRLALKFKYTLSDSDLVKILRATILSKHKPNIDLVNLMSGVNRKELPLCTLMQAYDYVTLAANLDYKNKSIDDGPGYVEDRSQLTTRTLPNVA